MELLTNVLKYNLLWKCFASAQYYNVYKQPQNAADIFMNNQIINIKSESQIQIKTIYHTLAR